ncbi:hypothetical protein COY05_00025 [Candidatus Peregrinibacteria bacterium CG_4_10_14_0_2_um_filter_38_24]|nr:MAG: hypothetical protein COY05_00025 [Candidatus Peregrinibacteria bacterium CG_4_10_14_0_2_um_filter_38_24]PJC38506.1 MAG: hypothetical protein CO044_04630 [Candidatus Peregrinibacteria bacterium CG_4_9_14_0_2_um_filter_38_9]
MENSVTPNLVNPLDVQNKENATSSDIVKNLITSDTHQEKFLEEAPTIDFSLLKDIVPQQSPLLSVLKYGFIGIAVAFLLSIVFFVITLTDAFSLVSSFFGYTSLTTQLENDNTDIISLKTELNFNKYLMLKGSLDEFGYYGDAFAQNYEILNTKTSSAEEKSSASEKIASIKPSLKKNFMEVKDIFSKDFDAPLYTTDIESQDTMTLFKQKLTDKFNAKAAELKESTDPQTKRDYKNYMQIVALISNADLKTLVLGTDFDALKDEDLYKLINKVNSIVVNDLNVIQQIKNKRIKWSDIINEINLRTIAVDSSYNQDVYNELGGIRYMSYDFDSESKKLSISGETKIFDTTNFTIITDLIDSLNNSTLFSNAEMRSFSKSGSLDEGYKANVNVSLTLKDKE